MSNLWKEDNMNNNWKKGKFVYTQEYKAIQFDPKVFPWHHSIQRQTIQGKIPDDFEKYFCIIPLEKIEHIQPGDWIIVDDMNNAKGVISKFHLQCGWSQIE